MEEHKISLAPGGEALIGIMSVRNDGDAHAVLTVRGDGPILRRELIIDHHDANTPALRVYYLVTVLYMVPDAFTNLKEYFINATKEMVETLPQSRTIMSKIGRSVIMGDYAQAHEFCFQLMALEESVANGLDP
ncbi:MAG: hypothetical protein OEW37_06530 [Rhodospirillaceae bacterium]|nr:hypothetical protein [Rhodospirillaceae bacterium]